MVGHKWKIEQENGEQVIGTTEYFPKGYDEKTIIGKTLEILLIGCFPARMTGKVVEYLGIVSFFFQRNKGRRTMVKKKDMETFLSAANTFLSEGKKLSNDSKTVTITGQTEGVHVQVIGRNAHGNTAFVNGFFNCHHVLNDKAMTFPFEEFKGVVSLIDTEDFLFSLSEDGERKEYLNIGLSKTYKILIDDDKYARIFEEDIEEAQKSAVFCVDKKDYKRIIDNTKDCLGCFTRGLDRIRVRTLASGNVVFQATNETKAWQGMNDDKKFDRFEGENFNEELGFNVSLYLFKALNRVVPKTGNAVFKVNEFREGNKNIRASAVTDFGVVTFVEARQEFYDYPSFESLKERILKEHTGTVKIKQSYIEKIIKTGEVMNKGQKDKKMRKIRLAFLDGDSVMQVAYFKEQEKKVLDEEFPVECTGDMPEEIFFNTKVFDCFLNTGEEYVTLMVGEGTVPVMSKTNNEIRFAAPMMIY